MQAWGLKRKQYLVLMIRFLSGYRTIEQVQNESTLSGSTQIRVGLCERYKPTLENAMSMFGHVTSKDHNARGKTQKPTQVDKSATATNRPLQPLFIGGPINDLFRDRFSQILKYRMACAFPWSGAEMFYQDVQGKNMGDINTGDPRYLACEDTNGHTLPPIVTADTIEETISGLALSLPLAAMQFLLRHFVRCTEFCLVCHCRVDATFEALKPYVCSKPLCLYPYMYVHFPLRPDVYLCYLPPSQNVVRGLYRSGWQLYHNEIRQTGTSRTILKVVLNGYFHFSLTVPVDLLLNSQLPHR
jgi:ubiquitin-conjugating enzyme E2 Q